MSNFAITTKTKAMFSKRLTERDYLNLMSKHSVADIVSYLKSETHFKDSLEGVNEKAIRRGQLEILIRNDLLFRLSKILKFSPDLKQNLFKSVIFQSEITLIMEIVKSFYDDEKQSFLDKLPILIEQHLSFDLKKVASSTNFQGLLESLKNTDYYQLLKVFSTNDIEEISFMMLEKVLYDYYYEQIIKLLKQNYNAEKSKLIKDIFYTQVELENINKIYRLKKYFKADKETIKSVLIPYFHRFSKKDIDDMIEDSGSEIVINKLLNSSYRNFIKTDVSQGIEYLTSTIVYNMNLNKMFFSNDSDVIVLIYSLLAKTEIQNIIDIIEAVRYKVAKDNIKEMLIY